MINTSADDESRDRRSIFAKLKFVGHDLRIYLCAYRAYSELLQSCEFVSCDWSWHWLAVINSFWYLISVKNKAGSIGHFNRLISTAKDHSQSTKEQLNKALPRQYLAFISSLEGSKVYSQTGWRGHGQCSLQVCVHTTFPVCTILPALIHI